MTTTLTSDEQKHIIWEFSQISGNGGSHFFQVHPVGVSPEIHGYEAREFSAPISAAQAAQAWEELEALAKAEGRAS